MAFTRERLERELRFRSADLAYYIRTGDASNAEVLQIAVDAIKFQLENTMDDKTNEVVTGRPPVNGEEAGWFCVIGPNVTQNHPIKRTWKTDQEAAAKHAEKLINNSFDGRTTKVKRLLVVKVVEVIEVAGPPITRRTGGTITSDDVGDDQEGE